MYDQPGHDPVYWANVNKKTNREKILEKTRDDVAHRKYFEWDEGYFTSVMYQYLDVDHVMIAIEEYGDYITDGVWRIDGDTFLVRDDIDPESLEKALIGTGYEDSSHFVETYNNYFNSTPAGGLG
jgi:hypothetical protein